VAKERIDSREPIYIRTVKSLKKVVMVMVMSCGLTSGPIAGLKRTRGLVCGGGGGHTTQLDSQRSR